MAGIESAEEFAGRLLSCQQREGWLALIEARDNATRLAGAREALASLENRIREQFVRERRDSDWRQILPILLREQVTKFENKYTQPVEPGQEKR